MARKRFLLITLFIVLCVAIVRGTAGAATGAHSAAARSAKPSDVVQDNVYLITSSTSLTALNASTGALLWQFQPGGYIDPPTVVNHIVYTLVLSSDSLYALNENTGATLWTFHPSGFVNTPVISSAVYITVDSSTSNSSTLYALNPKTGATLWNFQPGTNLGTPVISQNVVYIATIYSTSIYALSASKGKLLWHSQPSTYSFYLESVANGILYGDAEGPKYSFGMLWAFSTRNGSLLWTFVGSLWAEGHSTTYVEGGTLADPLICGLNASNGSQRWCTSGYAVTLIGGLVYVTTGQSSFSVYKDSNSSLLWSNAHARFLTAASGFVYGVDTNNFVEALKARNGSLLWRSSTTYGVGMYFFVLNGLLTASSADNLSVYTLKASSGTLQWRYSLPQTLFSISTSQGIVFVTTLSGTIYALKASSGTLVWKH